VHPVEEEALEMPQVNQQLLEVVVKVQILVIVLLQTMEQLTPEVVVEVALMEAAL
jgi:hypothetical protein